MFAKMTPTREDATSRLMDLIRSNRYPAAITLSEVRNADKLFSHFSKWHSALYTDLQLIEQARSGDASETKLIDGELRKQLFVAIGDARGGKSLYDDNGEENVVTAAIADRMILPLRSLAVGRPCRLANTLFLAYYGGVLPEAPLEIEGNLAALVFLSPEEARAKFEAAHYEEYGKKYEIGRRLIEFDGPVPDAEVLEKVLVFSPDSAPRIVTEDEPGLAERGVPESWRQLLQQQQKGKSLKWDLIWGPVKDRFPGVMKFLKKHCRGIAIALRNEAAPVLLYLYAVPSDAYKVGLAYHHYEGNVPATDDQANLLDRLPTDLQAFYKQVHDGWTAYDYDGPCLCGSWPFCRSFLTSLNVSERNLHQSTSRELCLCSTFTAPATAWVSTCASLTPTLRRESSGGMSRPARWNTISTSGTH